MGAFFFFLSMFVLIIGIGCLIENAIMRCKYKKIPRWKSDALDVSAWHKRVQDEWEEESRVEAEKIGTPTHEILVNGTPTLVTQAGHSYYMISNGRATRVSAYHEGVIVGFPQHTQKDRDARDVLIPLLEKMIASTGAEAYTHNLGMGLTSPAVRFIGAPGLIGPCAYFYGHKLIMEGLRDVPKECDVTTAERERLKNMIRSKPVLPPLSADELVSIL